MAKTPPKKKEAKPKPTKQEAPQEKEGFRGIVRIAGKDIRGNVTLRNALFHVRGIGHSLAQSVSNIVASETGIAPEMQVGDLSDSQIAQIDAILFSLQQHGLPKFLLNRRSDKQDGTDRHVIMNDLLFAVREDIEGEKKLYTWKGFRHSYGQKVRGQRTRNTGRTGMAVGVLRKAVLAQAAAAKAEAAPAKGGGAPAPAAKPGEKAPTAAPAPAAKPAAEKK